MEKNLTIILETKLEAGRLGEGGRRRWGKFLLENKTIQLRFLPNAGGLWKEGGGGQFRGKQALLGVAREARGPEHCSPKGGSD